MVFKNGELLEKTYEEGDTYSSFCIQDDGDKIVEAVQSGEPAYMIITSKTCSHCVELEEKFCKAIASLKIEVYLVQAESNTNYTTVSSCFSKIRHTFPAISDTFESIRFPYSYLIESQEKATAYPFTGHQATSSDVLTYLNSFLHTENFIRFQKEESFLSYINKGGVGYIYQNSSSFLPLEKEIKGEIGIYQDENKEEGFYIQKENHLTRIEKEEALAILNKE